MNKILFTIAVLSIFCSFLLIYRPVYAASTCGGGFSASQCSACAGISQLGNSQNCATNGSSVTGVIRTVIKVLAYIVGIAAVVMLILAGFKFITSGGSAEAVKSAKSMIIYAIVGLVVVALAEIIVHSVLNSAASVSSIINIKEVVKFNH